MSSILNNVSVAALMSGDASIILDVSVPYIKELGCVVDKFGHERGWEQVSCRPWQTLSPLNPSEVVEKLLPYYGFTPILLGTTAFFGRNGKFTGLLARLPQGTTVDDLVRTYEEAITHFQIAYRIVPHPFNGEPSVLFLAPGESGEIIPPSPVDNSPF